MKRLLSALLFLLPLLVNAQEEVESNDRYIRNSISVMFVDYGDQYTQSLSSFYHQASLSNRFDINDLGIDCIRLNEPRDNYVLAINGERVRAIPDRTATLTAKVNEMNLGKQILAYLFNRQENGYMDLERIESRGEYTAHDVDMTLSNSLKVGIAKVRDEGIQLINRSYIIIYDNANLRQEYRGKDDSRELYWAATSSAYLFKIKFDEQTLYSFYDNCWMDQETPAEEVAAKKTAFEQLYIPMECIMKVDCNLSKSTNIENSKRLKIRGGISDKERSEKAYNKLITETFTSLNFNIEKNNEDFVLKIPITNMAPIRAKIGTKEGVTNGLRFYVYSNRGRSDGSVVAVRHGVIRATRKIADNQNIASGKSPESQFVKIAGYRSIEEGMTIQEKKDLGLGFNLGAGGNTILKAEATYQLLANRFTCSYIHLGAGIRPKTTTIYGNIGYGIHIPNLEIYPYIGYGEDSFKDNNDDKEDDSDYAAQYFQYGIRANLAISYPLYLFGGIETNTILSEGSIYSSKSTSSTTIEGSTIYLGIRYCF